MAITSRIKEVTRMVYANLPWFPRTYLNITIFTLFYPARISFISNLFYIHRFQDIIFCFTKQIDTLWNTLLNLNTNTIIGLTIGFIINRIKMVLIIHVLIRMYSDKNK
ncbi:hypothetical protein GLOIN_2v1170208 [Rhizophagus irregularis DAOM 181602=DAOM 197198]|uniref:Uncharacterized protein n=1 Tax=Rhizophagus irregularis (strain DAOM 181602 / DAOM 197198 / MUCL 43194) TaxID=747089 RepID=A0A2P4Q3Z3_RHIID|nr:hypothetical protein GLOIN_2v1170208 [Rhizophagus irregularis DAOM 181602=DAOM 197198]POG72302.1 hypothetical protein GLOIN_2v1170208 [Rhizophagus irregularis DAOM 181602=DAOM 197198]GET64931.1 hypothetical protein GLOIN_2v1170208 [Rhizophagus irregularis DAOM 181602=DAOM 197198]|eukprot:XP_025179168.1 hypothetical protein GLOIN_2v1170208 [Rhizophagus irregularis DAOM 181602=DAOM 197198]